MPFSLLLVEDDLADAELFRELLSEVSRDITVHHVENGREALEFLLGPSGDAAPTLIVLDLNMPVMSGHEFLREAKAHARLRSIPVLVLSTSDREEDVNRAYNAFASGYMVKPGTYNEYTRVLETVQAYWRGVMRLPTVGDLAAG